MLDLFKDGLVEGRWRHGFADPGEWGVLGVPEVDLRGLFLGVRELVHLRVILLVQTELLS